MHSLTWDDEWQTRPTRTAAIPAAAPWLAILLTIHIGSQVKQDSQSHKLKEFDKTWNLPNCEQLFTSDTHEVAGYDVWIRHGSNEYCRRYRADTNLFPWYDDTMRKLQQTLWECRNLVLVSWNISFYNYTSNVKRNKNRQSTLQLYTICLTGCCLRGTKPYRTLMMA